MIYIAFYRLFELLTFAEWRRERRMEKLKRLVIDNQCLITGIMMIALISNLACVYKSRSIRLKE